MNYPVTLAQINETTRETVELLVNAGVPALSLLVMLLVVVLGILIVWRSTRSESTTKTTLTLLSDSLQNQQRMIDQADGRNQVLTKQADVLQEMSQSNHKKLELLTAVNSRTLAIETTVKTFDENSSTRLHDLQQQITAANREDATKILNKLDDIMSRFDSIENHVKENASTSLQEHAQMLNEISKARTEIIATVQNILKPQPIPINATVTVNKDFLQDEGSSTDTSPLDKAG
jgi:hypothetical protein